MRIRMLITAASPVGTWLARREYDVSDELGRHLVSSGAAIALSGAQRAVRPTGRVAARTGRADEAVTPSPPLDVAQADKPKSTKRRK